ncbi:hypothetical protein PIB30_049640 [Stylosanthes scabra]|uniref:Pentatricopeptide repeat-containing protein n=1 Tax=Stylosanthes scabra TaxID=79078 RepID=A0ABU6QHW7_9FABA|nr:hypothetical protein [Stylosanthes scabra]
MKQARVVFDKMPERDFVSWNTMIVGYARNGVFHEALKLYGELRRLCIGYNGFSFASLLIVCVKSKDFELSRQVHGQVLVVGFFTNVVVSSSIVDAYAKCGKMKEARRLFDEMSVRDIPAWTTLVSGYAACGNMESAAEVFYQMPQKNSYSWTSLIVGYAKNGMGHEALGVFRKMIQHRVRPDKYTFHSCFLACAIIASLKHGKQLHSYLVQNNIRPNTVVLSAIIDMYSKCGSLETAKKVFELNGNKQDVVLWNSMISALAYCGYGTDAVMMLNDMLRSGMKPDRATFVSILNACSHSGLVQEGLQFFMSMTSEHGVVPDQEHYACLVNLLHRAGCFNKSATELQVMDPKPGEHVDNCLLGLWGKLESTKLEREVHRFPFRLQLQSSAAYLLLSSVYVALVKRGTVEKMRQIMHERYLRHDQAVT